MQRKFWNVLTIVIMLSMVLVLPVGANPPAPGDDAPHKSGLDSLVTKSQKPKDIDQPNFKDYQRLQERLRLLEAGDYAGASALAQTGTDRVLVILVEFAGTDVFTWNPGDTWDPLGKYDPNEAVFDEDGNIIDGDCSNIITQTQTFTYTGPLHNMMEKPLSAEDRSGDAIWTTDFSPQWFEDFMFGNGVDISYTRQDGSTVSQNFIGQSVADYYSDLSSGTYTVTGDVIGWLSLDHSTWYYGADECPGRRSFYDTSISSAGAIPGAGSSRTLVQDALDAVNAISDTITGFDWANYDQDGDGIIDRLWIVHAGYGEEDGTDLLNRDPVVQGSETTAAPEAFYGESAMWSHSSGGTVYQVTPDIAAGPYIMMPENGGIGVFAHEYGHNLGAWDLYSYADGETSAGFWTLMADDWTGYPIGFEPPAVDPTHLDLWGWLNPMVVTDTSQSYDVYLGQASRFANNTAPGTAYRGVKIELPDGQLPLAVPLWQGDYYWWFGKQDVTNSMLTTKDPIAVASGDELTFDLVYDIEDEWDFLWVQASTDGATWDTLTNENT
jgi:immune inhibitor A